jgi:hypothetical protein
VSHRVLRDHLFLIEPLSLIRQRLTIDARHRLVHHELLFNELHFDLAARRIFSLERRDLIGYRIASAPAPLQVT